MIASVACAKATRCRNLTRRLAIGGALISALVTAASGQVAPKDAPSGPPASHASRASAAEAAASLHESVVFFDAFDEASRGGRRRNGVVNPPPAGMGYTTDTPHGFEPKNWIVVDREAGKARCGFWCIPERGNGTVESFMQQSGRSHDSIAYAGVPVPADAHRVVIEFKQWCNDNDYIGYIVGATQPILAHDGVEFGYERQIPNTDQTVNEVYYRGALGTGKIEGMAKMRRWVAHRIEIEGTTIRWFQDGTQMLEGSVPVLKRSGYFGIRHRYERGTRYDDVRITTLRPKG